MVVEKMNIIDIECNADEDEFYVYEELTVEQRRQLLESCFDGAIFRKSDCFS